MSAGEVLNVQSGWLGEEDECTILTERSKSAAPVAGSHQEDHGDVCARKATRSSYHKDGGEMFWGEKVRRITREGAVITKILQHYKTKHGATLG